MEGRYIKILWMVGEPQYDGKIGRVIHEDSLGQIHGTWGGCAIIPEKDEFEVLSELRTPLFERCEKTKTNLEGINTLVDYYIKSLGWTEKQACDYALSLFEKGTIDEIKLLNK